MKTEVGKHFLVGMALVLGFFCPGCVSTDEPSDGKRDPAERADPVIAKSTTPEEKWIGAYENDFSSYAVGEEPDDLFILDGEFAVQEIEGNKVLALPGTPIGDFGILFGPRIKDKAIELRCRLFSTRKGRRLPAFMAGIGGLNGVRLRIDCAADKLRLIRGDELLSETPFAWKSGSWTSLRFKVEPLGGEEIKISGKVWDASRGEPSKWSMAYQGKLPFTGGKCVLWGIPYASSEIFFDDVKVFSLAP